MGRKGYWPLEGEVNAERIRRRSGLIKQSSSEKQPQVRNSGSTQLKWVSSLETAVGWLQRLRKILKVVCAEVLRRFRPRTSVPCNLKLIAWVEGARCTDDLWPES